MGAIFVNSYIVIYVNFLPFPFFKFSNCDLAKLKKYDDVGKIYAQF